MVRTALLLSIVLSAGIFAAASSPQVPLALNSTRSPTEVLTQELRDELAASLARTGRFGYAVGVVRPHAKVQMEYFMWGNRTEDGEPMTQDVRPLQFFCVLNTHRYSDHRRDRQRVQAVYRDRAGARHG
jgi:hypothetical protein